MAFFKKRNYIVTPAFFNCNLNHVSHVLIRFLEIQQEFYEKCAKLLGTDSLYVEQPKPVTKYSRETGEPYQPMTHATRWGGREPGNGRFPGHGTIRIFSPEIINVSLRNPQLSGTFDSFEAVLDALRFAVEKEPKEVKEVEIGDLVHVVLAGEDYGMCKILRKVEEYDSCWKVEIKLTYSNGKTGTAERYWYGKD